MDEKIRNYYEIGDFLTDEEMKEIDEAAKKDDIPIADKNPKRGRKRAKKEESENPPTKEKEEVAKSDADVESEPAEKRTRKTREEVIAENEEKLANAGMDEAGDKEEVSFDEAPDVPELEKVPRRTRKKREEEPARDEPEPQEEEQETATPCRRRRRV